MTTDRSDANDPSIAPARSTSAFYDGSQPLSPILAQMSIPMGKPVLVVVGTAASEMGEEAQDAQKLLMERAIAPVCRDEGVVVVSGGTDAGVMAALGNAIAEYAPEVVLVGVAPHGKLLGHGAHDDDDDAALPERNHRLIRTPGAEWGAEGTALVQIAERIAGRSGIVVLALGGGKGTQREIKLAARRRWPMILATGLGGESEKLALALKLSRRAVMSDSSDAEGPTTLAKDKDVAAAVAASGVVACEVGNRDEFARALRWRLSENALLREAWARFSGMDVAATLRKQPTTRLALSVLFLAAVTVLCAVLVGLSKPPSTGGQALISRSAGDALKGVVTALPLLAAALLGLSERRARSGTWVELRAAAESILREIYRWRGATEPYRSAVDAPALFGEALALVDTRTEGRSAALPVGSQISGPWPPPDLLSRIPSADSLLGPLTASAYDQARVLNQLRFLEEKVKEAERGATRLAMTIFLTGGSSAFLLAISWRWADATVAAAAMAGIAAALISWREYLQREARAEAMRATCSAVRSARGRWLALSTSEREEASRTATYVSDVEEALAAEGSDWERSLRQAQHGFLDRQRGR